MSRILLQIEKLRLTFLANSMTLPTELHMSISLLDKFHEEETQGKKKIFVRDQNEYILGLKVVAHHDEGIFWLK